MHLTRQVVRLSNRLRAVLWRYSPAALAVFGGLDSQIALEFVRVYPTPQAAAELTLAEFKAFAQRQRYTHPRELPQCFGRLRQPQPEADRDTVLVFKDEAVELATLLLSVVRAKQAGGAGKALPACKRWPGCARHRPQRQAARDSFPQGM